MKGALRSGRKDTHPSLNHPSFSNAHKGVPPPATVVSTQRILQRSQEDNQTRVASCTTVGQVEDHSNVEMSESHHPHGMTDYAESAELFS